MDRYVLLSDNSADSESVDIFHSHLPRPNKDNVPDSTESTIEIS